MVIRALQTLGEIQQKIEILPQRGTFSRFTEVKTKCFNNNFVIFC